MGTSSTAARIFNIWPQKGLIAPGSDADIVVWDPNRTRVISASTHHHAVDFNIFEGQEVHGVADWVITGGRLVVEDGKVMVTRGAGRFIPNLPFSPYVYDKVKEAEEKKAAAWVPVKRSAEDMFVDMSGEGRLWGRCISINNLVMEIFGDGLLSSFSPSS